MNQTFDITLSFIIGGMVIFSLIGLTLHFNGKSQEVKLAEITQRSILETGEIIDHDFRKLGFGRDVDSSLVSIRNKSITFKSDLENNRTVNRVSYSEVTENGKVYLQRRIDNLQSKTWKTPIAAFSIFGISANGDTTNTIANVKSIVFELRLSEKSLKGDTFILHPQIVREDEGGEKME
ncbi:MAG TPA: hypothetical protein PK559_11485, partial [Ignavibacteriaceae bacterium]|nr:hypothetical protein [Ignavibacteriaceae bacterium]